LGKRKAAAFEEKIISIMIKTRSQPADTRPALYRVGTRIYRIIQLTVTGALLLAVIYGWYWLSDPTEFPIRSVKIQAPREHVAQQTIQTEVLPYVTQGFLRLNANELKEKLLENPWIAEVQVERIWPDGVVIKITEQQAVANWGKMGLLNTKGAIFSPPTETIPTGLPQLNGPPDQAAIMWTDYEKIAEMLKPLALKVRELDMDERLSLQLDLENGTRLLLGKKDPLPRLQRFAKVYHKIFTSPNAQATSVDLRYQNGVSVKWRDFNNNQ
jgi:cell division protein FtsQ